MFYDVKGSPLVLGSKSLATPRTPRLGVANVTCKEQGRALNRQARVSVPQRLIQQRSAYAGPPKSHVHPRLGILKPLTAPAQQTSQLILPRAQRHIVRAPGDIPVTNNFDEEDSSDDSPIDLSDIDERTNYRKLMEKFRSASPTASMSSTGSSHRKWQIRIPPISRLPRSAQPPIGEHSDGSEHSRKLMSTPRLVKPMGEYLNFENWAIDDTYLGCLCHGHAETLRNVQHVNVAHNRIGAQGFMDLFGVLRAPDVQSINIEDNQCGEKGGLVIARTIYESRWPLTELNLSANSLGDGVVEKLCQALVHCKQLAGLGLAKNELGKMDRSGQALGNFISNCNSLSVLDLHWNYYRGAGGLALITGIYENSDNPSGKMTRLNLAWNRLGAPIKTRSGSFANLSAKMISSVFQCSASLFHLDLSYNGFGSAECKILADGLRTNHTLFGIHLNGNECSVDDLGFIMPHPASNIDVMNASQQQSTMNQRIEEIPTNLSVDFIVRNNMVSKEYRQDAIHKLETPKTKHQKLGTVKLEKEDSQGLNSSMSTTSVTSLSSLRRNSSFPIPVSANVDTEKKWVKERSKVQRPEDFGDKEIDAFRRNARCCWICENWVAHEINYIPGLSDETKKPEELDAIKSIYAFFGIDGFTRPIKLTPLEETYSRRMVQPETKKSAGRQPALTKNGKLIRWVGKRMLPPSMTEAEVIFQVNENLKLSDNMHIKPLKEPVRIKLFTEEKDDPILSVTEVNAVPVVPRALQNFLKGDRDPLVFLEDPKQRDTILVVPRKMPEEPHKEEIKSAWTFEISCWYGFKFFNDFDATFEHTRKGHADVAGDCFDLDVKCIKLNRFIKDEADLKEMLNFVRPVYKDFIVSYRHILSQCSPLGRPAMGAYLLEYTEWLASLKEDFFDDDFKQSRDSDTIFIAANLCDKEKREEFFKVIPEKGLSRCQFFEAVIRVCFKKYFQSGKCGSVRASLKEFHGLVVPHAQVYLQERRNFQNELFTEECDIVFKQYLDMLKTIYDSYTLKDFYNGRCGKALTYVSWTKLLEDANIEEVIPHHTSTLNDVWIMSKEMMIDELTSWQIMELNFYEFLVSLGAIIKFKPGYEPVFFADLLDEFFNDNLSLVIEKVQGSKKGGKDSDHTADAGMLSFFTMLRSLFAEMDDDGSGCISIREFRVVMSRPEVIEDLKNNDISISDTGVLFKQLDSDGSEEMTLDELCDGLAKIKTAMKGVERALAFIGHAFKEADADSSGVLSIEEVQSMLGSELVQRKLESLGIDVHECEDIIGFVDEDRSGEVSLDELTHALLKMRDPSKAGNRALNLMKKLFREADKDGSGSMSRTEMKKTFSDLRCIEKLEKLNLHFPDWDSLFDQLDEDTSGDVNWDELSRGMMVYWKNAKMVGSHSRQGSHGYPPQGAHGHSQAKMHSRFKRMRTVLNVI